MPDVYLALVPRGLQHVVKRMVRRELEGETTVDVVGEWIPDEAAFVARQRALLQRQQQQAGKRQSHKRAKTESPLTAALQETVGTLPPPDATWKNISIGYDSVIPHSDSSTNNNNYCWTMPGQLQGTVWMQIVTSAPAVAVARLPCLGPLLALVSRLPHLCLPESQTLDQAIASTQQALQQQQQEAYETQFQKALQVWHAHVQDAWTDLVSAEDRAAIATQLSQDQLSYRLSCMRTESKKYPYERNAFCKRLADDTFVIPLAYQDNWKVDLQQYNVEVVVLVRSHCVAVGLAVRPHQHVEAGAGRKSFGSGLLPADLHPPRLKSMDTDHPSIVRLRPSTACALLEWADLEMADVVLDPCVGMGTLPVQAALKESVVALGGDLVLTPDCMGPMAARYTAEAARVLQAPTNLCGWDASHLPVRTASVDVVISDLPFGRQCLSAAKLDSFLPLLLAEVSRVLCPTTGRAVFLCGAYPALLQSLLRANVEMAEPVWKLPCRAVVPVTITGIVAWVIRVDRGPGPPWTWDGRAARVQKATAKRALIARHAKTDMNKKKVKTPQA